jgi:hypothetical protein
MAFTAKVLALLKDPLQSGRVAQLVEHSTLNRLVVGSIPTASTTFLPIFQALKVPAVCSLRCVFQNLTKNLTKLFFAGYAR